MKINKFKVIPILLILISFLFANNCLSKNSKHPKKPPPQYRLNELVVKFNEGTKESEKQSARKIVNAKLINKIKSIDVELWLLSDEITLEDAINTLNGISTIKYAEPNYLVKPHQLPNDTNFNLQWYLNNTGQTVNTLTGTPDADISAVDAWDIETGNPDLIIAVLDSGFPFEHPDFQDNLWVNLEEVSDNDIDDDDNGYIDDINGYDFTNLDNYPADYSRQIDGSNGHGSHVAGIIAAQGNNALGTTGIMWDAQIMPLQVLDKFETAGFSGDYFRVSLASDYAVNNGAKIINMSLGGAYFSQYLYEAITYANENGVLVVCSAGNSADNNDVTPNYPASYNLPNIISVAATNELDELAAYSNYGLNTVDVAAPGGHDPNSPGGAKNIYSTLPPEREMIFFDDFESGGTKWLTSGAFQPWVIEYDFSFGSNVAMDSPSDYVSNELSFLKTKNPINAIGCQGLFAQYDIKYSLETTYDYAWAEISFDDINYITIAEYNGFSNPLIVSEEFYLGDLEFISPFYLRFKLDSDSIYNYDGVSLDNFQVSCVHWEYHGDEYGYMSGTSMAAPVVAGIAGLIWSKYPELTHLEVKEAILNSVDELNSLYLKVASGGRVNAARALELAAPDMDQDGIPDESDNCPSVQNPGQADSDSDRIGDACDNCSFIANEGQEDSNSNGIGDICDTSSDTDDDSLTDADEAGIYNTSPINPDTDDDGLNDGLEVDFWGADWNADLDGDLLVNLLDFDSDNDGLTDGMEVNILGTDPALSDSDNNGTLDGDEDNDSDGISNVEEVQCGSDPMAPESKCAQGLPWLMLLLD